MNVFSNELSNDILKVCSKHKDSGMSLRDILKSLVEVMDYILRVWAK